MNTKQFLLWQTVMNLLIVANAAFFLPRMIGHVIVDWRYAAGYVAGFMVISSAFAVLQVARRNTAARSEQARTEIALAVSRSDEA